jgi:hypothetical protein
MPTLRPSHIGLLSRRVDQHVPSLPLLFRRYGRHPRCGPGQHAGHHHAGTGGPSGGLDCGDGARRIDLLEVAAECVTWAPSDAAGETQLHQPHSRAGLYLAVRRSAACAAPILRRPSPNCDLTKTRRNTQAAVSVQAHCCGCADLWRLHSTSCSPNERTQDVGTAAAVVDRLKSRACSPPSPCYRLRRNFATLRRHLTNQPQRHRQARQLKKPCRSKSAPAAMTAINTNFRNVSGAILSRRCCPAYMPMATGNIAAIETETSSQLN